MRVAIYRRVSTDIQAEKGFSLEAQKLKLEQFASSQDWTIVADYCDDGYSAKSLERPAIQKLITDVKKREFDVVLILRLDRLVRSVVNLHELLNLFEKYDVKFKSSTETYDTTTPSGKMFITLVASLAQFERETTALRVFETMHQRAKQGIFNGGKTPIGYKRTEEGYVIDEEEAKIVKLIFELYETKGVMGIVKELNKKGYTHRNDNYFTDYNVNYILNNPVYIGKLRWNTLNRKRKSTDTVLVEVTQENFETIIDPETFDRIQKLRKSRQATNQKQHEMIYIYSGIFRCECGARYSGKRVREDKYYICSERKHKRNCNKPSVKEEILDDAFMSFIKLMNVDLPIELKESKIDVDAVQKQLKKLDEQEEKLLNLYFINKVKLSTYEKKLSEIEGLRKEYQEQLLQSELTTSVNVEDVISLLQNLGSVWKDFKAEYKKKFINEWFESVDTTVINHYSNKGDKSPTTVKVSGYKLKI
ncbi:MAG: Resolvase domain protein [Bacillales bacterium]|jgi:site-specific DNA recombinase|nr:Resolvase domain protein [Bacillales bacterium]